MLELAATNDLLPTVGHTAGLRSVELTVMLLNVSCFCKIFHLSILMSNKSFASLFIRARLNISITVCMSVANRPRLFHSTTTLICLRNARIELYTNVAHLVSAISSVEVGGGLRLRP